MNDFSRPVVALRHFVVLAAALVLALAGTQAQAALPISQWQNADGSRTWFMANTTLPMLDVRVDFDAGSRLEASDKTGTADALAAMLGKGVKAVGTQPARDENQQAERWADLAAQWSAAADADRFSVSLRTLTKPDVLPAAVHLLAQQLGAPALDARVWAREQSIWQAALAEGQTRPQVLADQAFSRAVFGTHPYGRYATAQSVGRIRVEDMQQFATLLTPCRARISMVGAITVEQARDISHQLLAHLPRACPALPALAPVQALAAAQELRLPFAAAQVQVLLGQPGIARNSPDFFAMLVGDHILGGGGFTSRLTEAVREKEGLTYSIYSTFTPLRDAGAFQIGFQTRPEQADKALRITRQVLADFVAHGPTAAELQAAKDNLMGGWPARMDSNAKLLGLVANIAWNDLPLDYLDHWPARIADIRAADVQAAFARHLQPQRMVTVLVGQVAAAPMPSPAATPALKRKDATTPPAKAASQP